MSVLTIYQYPHNKLLWDRFYEIIHFTLHATLISWKLISSSSLSYAFSAHFALIICFSVLRENGETYLKAVRSSCCLLILKTFYRNTCGRVTRRPRSFPIHTICDMVCDCHSNSLVNQPTVMHAKFWPNQLGLMLFLLTFFSETFLSCYLSVYFWCVRWGYFVWISYARDIRIIF